MKRKEKRDNMNNIQNTHIQNTSAKTDTSACLQYTRLYSAGLYAHHSRTTTETVDAFENVCTCA